LLIDILDTFLQGRSLQKLPDTDLVYVESLMNDGCKLSDVNVSAPEPSQPLTNEFGIGFTMTKFALTGDCYYHSFAFLVRHLVLQMIDDNIKYCSHQLKN